MVDALLVELVDARKRLYRLIALHALEADAALFFLLLGGVCRRPLRIETGLGTEVRCEVIVGCVVS